MSTSHVNLIETASGLGFIESLIQTEIEIISKQLFHDTRFVVWTDVSIKNRTAMLVGVL